MDASRPPLAQIFKNPLSPKRDGPLRAPALQGDEKTRSLPSGVCCDGTEATADGQDRARWTRCPLWKGTEDNGPVLF